VELRQSVHLPALQGEGGKKVLARVALTDSDSKGERRVEEGKRGPNSKCNVLKLYFLSSTVF